MYVYKINHFILKLKKLEDLVLRTKLSDRKLPNYSKGEELFNMISHIVGGVFGIIVLILCVIVSSKNNNVYGIVASVIYGVAMIILYTMSSIYHGLKDGTAKRVFQVLDHCTIYILIAGSYTPIALSSIRVINPALGWTIFGLEWGLAIIAIIFTAIDLKKYNVFSMISYIGMGWVVILFYRQTRLALTPSGFKYILLGGVFYMIGVVLYGVGKKKKYAHNVFHVFVLLGSITQFFGILLYGL